MVVVFRRLISTELYKSELCVEAFMETCNSQRRLCEFPRAKWLNVSTDNNNILCIVKTHNTLTKNSVQSA